MTPEERRLADQLGLHSREQDERIMRQLHERRAAAEPAGEDLGEPGLAEALAYLDGPELAATTAAALAYLDGPELAATTATALAYLDEVSGPEALAVELRQLDQVSGPQTLAARAAAARRRRRSRRSPGAP